MAGDLPLVVSSGTCVGCGASAVPAPQQIEMRLTRRGNLRPFAADGGELVERVESEVRAHASQVCPFSADTRNEDEIAMEHFGDGGGSHHDVTGYYRKIVAGHVTVEGYREFRDLRRHDILDAPHAPE